MRREATTVKVQPARPRSTVLEEPAGLRIIIPVKRSWPVVVFLAVWLCGWLAGEIGVPIGLLRGADPGAALFMALWLCFWTVAGAWAIYALLWSIGGREVAFVDGTLLVVTHHVPAFARSKAFDFAQVRDLRSSPVAFDPWNWGWSASLQWWGMGGGTVAFDYGAETHRFGAHLSEAEAKILVAAIRRRFKMADGSESSDG